MQNHAPFSSPILQLLGSHSKTYFWFLPAEHAFIFLKLAHLYVILNDRLEVAWKIKSFKDFVKLVLWNVSKLESNTFSMVSFGLYFFYPERSKISFVKSENSFFCKYAYLQNILYFLWQAQNCGGIFYGYNSLLVNPKKSWVTIFYYGCERFSTWTTLYKNTV